MLSPDQKNRRKKENRIPSTFFIIVLSMLLSILPPLIQQGPSRSDMHSKAFPMAGNYDGELWLVWLNFSGKPYQTSANGWNIGNRIRTVAALSANIHCRFSRVHPIKFTFSHPVPPETLVSAIKRVPHLKIIQSICGHNFFLSGCIIIKNYSWLT